MASSRWDLQHPVEHEAIMLRTPWVRAYSVCASLAFVVFLSFHLTTLQGTQKTLMVGLASAALLITASISVWLHVRPPGRRTLELASLALFIVCVTNCGLHAISGNTTMQLIYFPLLALLTGLIGPTIRLFVLNVIGIVAFGVIASLIVGRADAVRYAVAIMIAGVAAWPLFFLIRSTLINLIELRREVDRERQAALASAEAARSSDQAKTRFLANMSHEIRTPLNGVMGLAAALEHTQLRPEQQEILQLIQSSGQSLTRLLGDILDVSAIDEGHLALNLSPVNLSATVAAAAAPMRALALAKGLTYRVDTTQTQDIWVMADPVRLRQIITNLVSNAIKFTMKGEVGVSLRLAASAPDAPAGQVLIQLVVSDTGCGIDREGQARIFNRFEQADGTITRQFGGSGLGLTIARELAGLMGGTLSCISKPGEGSRFCLSACLALADCPAPARQEDEPACDLRGTCILIVEDHPVNRRVLVSMLEPLGVQVSTAEHGAQALSLLEHQLFDLILMDMQMPVMDGLTATRAIRARERAQGAARTPIAMVSANAMNEHVLEALNAGADHHIAKPVTLGGVLTGIAAAFDQCASHAQEIEEERRRIA